MRWQQPQPSTWARFLGTGALVSLAIITFLVFEGRFSNDVTKYALKSSMIPPPKDGSFGRCANGTEKWEFVAGRDANNHGLSEEQCLAAFPKLFVEADKSVEGRKANLVKYEELDELVMEDGMFRALIYNGELYVVDYADMTYTQTRAKSTLSSLNRALQAVPDRHNIPNVEFVLSSDDFSNGKGPVWSYSKRDEDSTVWLMPDFGYWSWPEVKVGPYKEIRRRIAAVDDGEVAPDGSVTPGMSFQDKRKQLLWRGSVNTNHEIRGKLLKAVQGQSWGSVRVIDWDEENDVRFNLLPMEEHCRYMFLAHTEGRSFSGRGKYLLNCRSVVVSHKLVWREAHHAALIASGPDANFVEVERDFSDLHTKLEFLIDNPEAAERIANNTVRTFRDRYLTPAAESCYWRYLVRRYASACEFEPVLYHADKDGKRQMRGTPFESWILSGH
ncbi:hypothetical protein P168DRAFT_324613 [Aspergillus campestris IBT 28561]|uniref:Glycosyl transferase CAP10 domain-containing protein n=1 Tax=Aspergillus campestris (strain IBT 28561) TaxID=1392248 RepID=A0A2I1DBC0_ASPC2|nr:uncharacterized protein P168DRAFT_324613 [Aspergillus campestris IBT 28561]PKY07178.1 hypothetical protein P168DRAFT_324613 [Aspergillus campestris IBT 28561]